MQGARHPGTTNVLPASELQRWQGLGTVTNEELVPTPQEVLELSLFRARFQGTWWGKSERKPTARNRDQYVKALSIKEEKAREVDRASN